MLNKERKNKKIIFDDDGQISKKKIKDKKRDFRGNTFKNSTQSSDQDVMYKKWHEIFPDYNITEEHIDIKDSEQQSLEEICKTAYEEELPHLVKKNPPDAKWLETALHKGTSKDRCNAGALLLSTNAIANIPTLETIIGFTKLSHKASSEVIITLTELLIEVLIPSNRKLLSYQLRGASWKHLRKQETLSKATKNKIYAYWYFEDRLKELYFDFLKNLQSCIQSGQDSNKNSAIISASKLLAFAPEKEQMILSMLINKLGDPSSKVAAKTLHHLTEVANKHPNMCFVITKEAEKLLFRNNISERAQHYTLCFLAQILPPGYSDVSSKVVNICFSLFKALVKKGAVNNKTMQAILRCLQKAIVDAKPVNGEEQILSKEMQDTIYRLVHLANIKISIQTLNLLLQMITVKTEKSDRFYNALYIKLNDMDLINIGNTTAAQFLKIVHKSMYIDKNIARIKAFIKRLLQTTLYLPANFACGCLIVINKLLNTRKDIKRENINQFLSSASVIKDEILAKFDDDIEENYKDVPLSDEENETVKQKEIRDSNINPSWHHLKLENEIENDNEQVSKLSYDAYHRASAFCGAETIENWELLYLKRHYHPSLKIFSENNIELKKISYYGDPLRDFGLSYFLERFCFKNPKKQENNVETNNITSNKHHKQYIPYGGRNISVKNLTKENCVEEEFFIFNFLEKKKILQQLKTANKVNDDDVSRDVDDDEFEEYLDGLVKQTKEKVGVEDDDDFAIDYMKELKSDMNLNLQSKSKKKNVDSDEEMVDDWDEDDELSEDNSDKNNLSGSESDEASESFNENDGDDSEDNISGNISNEDTEESDEDTENSDEDSEPTKKKTKYEKGFKNFKTALKEKKDIKSLFAAVDDFADILDKAGQTKDHGTSKQIFNKDKAPDKQLKWEEKRRSNLKNGKNWKQLKLNKNKFNKKFKK